MVEYRTIDVSQLYAGNLWAVGVHPLDESIPERHRGWVFGRQVVGRFGNDWVCKPMGLELVPLSVTLMGCDLVWIVATNSFRGACAKIIKIGPVGYRMHRQESTPVFASQIVKDKFGKDAFFFECPRCHAKIMHGAPVDSIEHRTSHCQCWENGYFIKAV